MLVKGTPVGDVTVEDSYILKQVTNPNTAEELPAAKAVQRDCGKVWATLGHG